MKKFFRYCAVLLGAVIVSATFLAGCGAPSIPVGKVYGQDITSKDVMFYSNAVLWLNNMTWADVNDAASTKDLYANALDAAVTLKVVMKNATDQKLYPLSVDDTKAIDTDLRSRLDALLKPLVDSYTSIAKTNTSIDPQKAAQKDLDAQMAKNNFNTEDMRRFLTEYKVYQLMLLKTQNAVTVTDAEVQSNYDSLLATQKDSYTKDPAMYETDKSLGQVVVFQPAGYRYVKHILISFPDDVASSIQAAVQSGDTATVTKLRNDSLPKIQTKADEALAKVKAGEDFDALIAEYGQDPGMQQDPAKTQGYELGKETSFVPEFKDAALALTTIGATTDLVASDYGYHIIKYVGDVASGPIPLDTVKENLKAKLLDDKKTKTWTDLLDQWKKDAGAEQNPDKMPLPSFSPSPSPSVSPAASGAPAESPAATDSASPAASGSPAASESPSATPSAS
jgi:parvulin-like peptidyl-prolyl isomerase